jgi:predicted AAA+ superfamily ATPase
VGRVEFLYLYPLSFGEFLTALGKNDLRNLIKAGKALPSPLHEQTRNLFRDYVLIGGMPAVLDQYINTLDIQACRKVQTLLIETFYADFPKYAKTHQIKYLQTVFSSIPVQLGRKFKYSNVSTLYKSRELKEALELLEKASLLHRVYHSSANGIPLHAERDDKKFKVVFFDTGLALNLLNIPLKMFFEGRDISLINEGVLAEQVAGQELVAYASRERKPVLYYWHREAKSSNAEVDYLLEQEGRIIPLEVKSGRKGRIRSLNLFLEEKGGELGIVISNTTGGTEGMIEYQPFYSMENIIAPSANLEDIGG